MLLLLLYYVCSYFIQSLGVCSKILVFSIFSSIVFMFLSFVLVTLMIVAISLVSIHKIQNLILFRSSTVVLVLFQRLLLFPWLLMAFLVVWFRCLFTEFWAGSWPLPCVFWCIVFQLQTNIQTKYFLLFHPCSCKAGVWKLFDLLVIFFLRYFVFSAWSCETIMIASVDAWIPISCSHLYEFTDISSARSDCPWTNYWF